MVNFGEVRRAHLAKSNLFTSMFVPWDLFRSFKGCSDAKKRVGAEKREATAPIQSLVKLQPWFLTLQCKTCLRQNCSLGSCACNEGPALGQNPLIIYGRFYGVVVGMSDHPSGPNSIPDYTLDFSWNMEIKVKG